MNKPRLAPEEKRVIIGARVTVSDKEAMMAAGAGNISRGLSVIMLECEAMYRLLNSQTEPVDEPSHA